VRSVSRVTIAIAEGPAAQWHAGWLAAQPAERDLVAAALRCVGRWGIRKTSLEDIAVEAGVSRATVYRVFPGGKERLVGTVIHHEVGRLIHDATTALRAADDLEQLLTVGMGTALSVVDHAVLRSVIAHEPELVLPHFAFDRLDGMFVLATDLCRPHLERFLPTDEIRRATELLVRVAITFALRPATWVDPHDPASIHQLVSTYLLPALTPSTAISSWET
jgi:AcrR family transcriptional regulator